MESPGEGVGTKRTAKANGLDKGIWEAYLYLTDKGKQDYDSEL